MCATEYWFIAKMTTVDFTDIISYGRVAIQWSNVNWQCTMPSSPARMTIHANIDCTSTAIISCYGRRGQNRKLTSTEDSGRCPSSHYTVDNTEPSTQPWQVQPSSNSGRCTWIQEANIHCTVYTHHLHTGGGQYWKLTSTVQCTPSAIIS